MDLPFLFVYRDSWSLYVGISFRYIVLELLCTTTAADRIHWYWWNINICHFHANGISPGEEQRKDCFFGESGADDRPVYLYWHSLVVDSNLYKKWMEVFHYCNFNTVNRHCCPETNILGTISTLPISKGYIDSAWNVLTLMQR